LKRPKGGGCWRRLFLLGKHLTSFYPLLRSPVLFTSGLCQVPRQALWVSRANVPGSLSYIHLCTQSPAPFSQVVAQHNRPEQRLSDMYQLLALHHIAACRVTQAEMQGIIAWAQGA
jgi:hypothetical protein